MKGFEKSWIPVVLLLALSSCDSVFGLGEEKHTTIYREVMDNGARYAVAVPKSLKKDQPAPLVLALHYGGTVTPYYGMEAMITIFEPALRKLGAIMVAPDCTGNTWVSSRSEEDVLAILDRVASEWDIDPERTLITGYSMGGAGTWHLAPRHPDRFKVALVVSGYPPTGVLDGPWTTPLYVIHSRTDEILPYEETVAAVEELESRGVTVELDLLGGIAHYQTDLFIRPMKQAVPWIKDMWER